MRTCEEYEALISALIDGALSEEDRAELVAHMAECPACQAYFNDQLVIHDALSGLEDQAPAGFTARVMDQVRRESAPERKPEKKVVAFPLWRRYAAMAACCAVVAAAGFWAFHGRMPSANSGVPAEAALSRDSAGAVEEQATAPADDEAAAAPEAAAADSTTDSTAGSAADSTAGSAADSQIPRKEDAPQAPPQAADAAGTEDQESAGMDGAPTGGAGGDGADGAAGGDWAESRPTLYGMETDSAADAAVTLTTGSALAEAWVAENLGETWTAGACYVLTVEQFDQVQALLEENGESFVLALPQEGEDQAADSSLDSAADAPEPPASNALTEEPPPADSAGETAPAGDDLDGVDDLDDGGEVTEGSPETEEPVDGADGSAADTPPLYILQAAP